jgi:putative copper resistance protein D
VSANSTRISSKNRHAASQEDALDDPLIWLRAIHLAATMMVTGGMLFHAFITGPAFRAANGTRVTVFVRARLATMAWTGLVATVVSGAAWLVLQAERMSEQSLTEVLGQGTIWTVLSETDFGSAWMVRLVLAVLLAAMLPWFGSSRGTESSRMRVAAVVVSAALVGTLAWAGHGAADTGVEGAIHLFADILHLIAAAAWVGALIPLALLLRAARRDESAAAVAVARVAVSRFSSFGIASVGTLVVTGSVNTWVLAGSVAALLDTDYGRLLLAKVALFLVMLSFGAINRLWLTPRLDHAPKGAAVPSAIRQIERNSLIEAALGAVVIAIVGLLGTLPPGLKDQAMN